MSKIVDFCALHAARTGRADVTVQSFISTASLSAECHTAGCAALHSVVYTIKIDWFYSTTDIKYLRGVNASADL